MEPSTVSDVSTIASTYPIITSESTPTTVFAITTKPMDSTDITTVKPTTMIMTAVSTAKLKVTKKLPLKKMGVNLKKVKDIVTTHNTKTTEGGKEEDDDAIDDNNDDLPQFLDILGMDTSLDMPLKRRRKKIMNNLPWQIEDINSGRRKNHNKKQQIIKEKNGIMKVKTNDFNGENKKVKPKTRTFGLLAAGLGALLGNGFQLNNRNKLNIIIMYRQRFPFFTNNNPQYYYDTNYAYYDDSQYAGNYYVGGGDYYGDTGGKTIFVTTTAETTDTDTTDTDTTDTPVY